MSQERTFYLQDDNRDMSLLDVGVRIGEIVQASNLCLNSKFPSAALSLIYVALDTTASLDYRLRKERPGARFVKWVDRYIVGSGDLPCSARDLYGARCGLLHTYSARSHLSSTEKVAEIWYAFHDHDADMFRKAVRKRGLKRVVILSLDGLTQAVANGITAFISDLESEQSLADWAISKAKQTFQFVERIGDELRPFPTLRDLEVSAQLVQKKPEQSN